MCEISLYFTNLDSSYSCLTRLHSHFPRTTRRPHFTEISLHHIHCQLRIIIIMDGLSPNALNLSTTEQSSYTLAFRELADLSDQDHPGDYCIMLTRIPEVRGWFKDRFFTLSLGQIDQVSSCTCQSRRHSVSGRSYR